MLVPMNDVSFRLDGRTVLLTGASGGLGRRFARVLHAAGARLVATGRDPDHPRLLALAEELGAGRAGSVERRALDVRDAASVDALFAALEADGARPDILINNAGIATGTPAIGLADADWDAVIETNLRGPWLLAQRFARARLDAAAPTGDASGDGRAGPSASIVNIGSILGSRVGAGTAPYAAAKAALVHLTRSLALEWARHGIRVNSLSPGYVLTDINRGFFETPAGEATIGRVPQRRIGEPSDLDGALLLLASDASAYMTGSDLVVDGGHLCSAL